MEVNLSTNIYIATFTRANARLRLYNAPDKLNNRVQYLDTNSAVWLDDGEIEFPTGNKIGDWEDEFKSFTSLNKDIHGITEWVSTGTKTYRFITNFKNNDGIQHSSLKFKGFVNNVVNCKTIYKAFS